jgi:hypothetical protein
MSKQSNNDYLMSIIKENVGAQQDFTYDANGKGGYASNGATSFIAQPVAPMGIAQMNQASRSPQAAVNNDQYATEEEEDEEEMQEAIDFENSLRSLLAEVNVSENFFIQAKTIFESAVDQKLKAIANEIAPALQENFESKLGEITVNLTEKIDDYLDYVVEEWMQDNQLAVEGGIKSTLAENFILGLKKLFEMHYVDVPAEKYNVIDGLYEQTSNLQGDLNHVLNENIALKKQLLISECAGIFVNETKDLADTQIEKLASLIENIEFSTLEEYKTKLFTLKDHYLGSRVAIPEQYIPEMTFSKAASTPTTLIENYTHTLDRLAKKL